MTLIEITKSGKHCIVGIGYTFEECIALVDHFNIENYEIVEDSEVLGCEI